MPAGASAGAAAPPRKPGPGQPWLHQETVSLIQSYEAKWYSLKRGQLKAQQWEDVAADVASRCGLVNPSKTGTQCRHKIEKLRKRYRSERLRIAPSPWPYFDLMDRMDRGPLPISARPPDSSSEDVGEDDDNEQQQQKPGSNTRSINGILRQGNLGFSRNPIPLKRRDFEMEDGEDDDEDDVDDDLEEGGGRDVLAQLAAVVRRFGDGMVRMEKRRMEMMREVEKEWMEMEAKRAEMLIASQRCLLETIAGAFSAVKKAKKSQGGV